jgi:alkylation response protein AidB-like acyl-CoA dehydrogenase
VAAGATAVGYTGYLKALAYARERLQGRALGDKDPSRPPVPIIEHTDVRRMLLAQKSYVEGALALVLYCARLVDETVDKVKDTAKDASTGDDPVTKPLRDTVKDTTDLVEDTADDLVDKGLLD